MDELGPDAEAQFTFDVSSGADGTTIVRVAGELDMTTAEELEAAVAPVIQSSRDRLVVDVGGLDFADSSAIALFVRWANRVRRIEIREPSPLLRRVIERMGLAERLPMTP
jgi:anti-anti-sigma factor